MKAAGHWDLPRRGREGRRLCLHFSHKSRWKPSRAFPLAAGLAGKPRTAAPAHTPMRSRCGAVRAGGKRRAARYSLRRPRAGKPWGASPLPRKRARALPVARQPAASAGRCASAARARATNGSPSAANGSSLASNGSPSDTSGVSRASKGCPSSPEGPTKPPAAPPQHCPSEKRAPHCFLCAPSGNGQFFDRHCHFNPLLLKSLLDLGLQVI